MKRKIKKVLTPNRRAAKLRRRKNRGKLIRMKAWEANRGLQFAVPEDEDGLVAYAYAYESKTGRVYRRQCVGRYAVRYWSAPESAFGQGLWLLPGVAVIPRQPAGGWRMEYTVGVNW